MQKAKVRRALLFTILFATLPSLGGGGGALQAAPDIRINSTTAEEQAEPAVVINPTNPMNLFAAWRDLRAGRASIGHARSLDGGATWVEGIFDDPRADILYDPSVGADSQGNIYLAFGIDFLPVGSGSTTWVLKSNDGGLTFGPPVSTGPFVDKPFLGIDRSTNAIYVAGNAVDARGRGGLFVTRSTDGGATFGPLHSVTRNPGVVNAPAFGPNGEIYLCWPYFSGGRIRVLFNRSLDGGATWLPRDVQVAVYHKTNSLLNGGVNADHLVSIASDRGSGAFAGRLYAVWHQAGSGGEDVVLSRSSDGGDTWSAPIRVNDDPVSSPADQFLPWVNVDDAGRVQVTFLDRRDDPANVNFALYLATSTDGGGSFAANVRVSDNAFPPSPATTFVGDYNAADAGAGRLQAIWADARNGDLDVFTEAILPPSPGGL